MTAPLYNRDILALAVASADFLPLDDAALSSDVRAPLCGSHIHLDLDCDAAGHVTRVGMKVEACALGQAAATLFARHAAGLSLTDIAAARAAIAGWFDGAADLPDWPGFALLAPARDFPARHGAILLPFDAAIKAFGQSQPAVVPA